MAIFAAFAALWMHLKDLSNDWWLAIFAAFAALWVHQIVMRWQRQTEIDTLLHGEEHVKFAEAMARLRNIPPDVINEFQEKLAHWISVDQNPNPRDEQAAEINKNRVICKDHIDRCIAAIGNNIWFAPNCYSYSLLPSCSRIYFPKFLKWCRDFCVKIKKWCRNFLVKIKDSCRPCFFCVSCANALVEIIRCCLFPLLWLCGFLFYNAFLTSTATLSEHTKKIFLSRLRNYYMYVCELNAKLKPHYYPDDGRCSACHEYRRKKHKIALEFLMGYTDEKTCVKEYIATYLGVPALAETENNSSKECRDNRHCQRIIQKAAKAAAAKAIQEAVDGIAAQATGKSESISNIVSEAARAAAQAKTQEAVQAKAQEVVKALVKLAQQYDAEELKKALASPEEAVDRIKLLHDVKAQALKEVVDTLTNKAAREAIERLNLDNATQDSEAFAAARETVKAAQEAVQGSTSERSEASEFEKIVKIVRLICWICLP